MKDESNTNRALPLSFQTFFGILLVAALLNVWLPQYLPLTDYPEHLLAIHILAHYNDSPLHYVRDYTYQLGNVPYLVVYLLGMFLNKYLSILTVGKLLLSFYVILTPLSILVFVRSFSGTSPWSSLFSFVFLFNFFYYLGSLNFLLSIPLAFFCLAHIVKRLGPSRKTHPTDREGWELIRLSVLMIALLYTHIVSYGAVLLVAVGLLVRARMRRVSGIKVIISILPSILFAASTSIKECASTSSHFGMSWLPFTSRVFDLLQPFLIYRDDYFHKIVVDRFCLPLLLFAIGWVLIALVARFRGFHPTTKNGNETETAHLHSSWIIVLLFLLAAVTFPSQLPSASVAHRLSVFVLLSLCATFPGSLLERRVIKSIFLLTVVYAFGVTGWRAYEFNKEMKPFLDTISRMEPEARVLPLVQNLHSRDLRTYCFLHIINYYHLEKGGSNPYLLFRNMPQIPVHYRFLDQLPSVGSFEPDLFDWQTHHDHYRYFLAREPSDKVMIQLREYTQLIFNSEGWYLFENRQ